MAIRYIVLRGTPRTQSESATTTIHNHYQERALKLIGVDTVEAARDKSYQQEWVTPDGEPIPLTKTMVWPETGDFLWLHTPVESIPKILNHVETLYQNTMRLPAQPEHLNQTVEQVAQMHWLLAHAMPYLRGSAGIADMFTKAIFDAKGIHVSRWKEGLAPDLEALVTPLSEYIRQYASLFETKPVFIKP